MWSDTEFDFPLCKFSWKELTLLQRNQLGHAVSRWYVRLPDGWYCFPLKHRSMCNLVQLLSDFGKAKYILLVFQLNLGGL